MFLRLGRGLLFESAGDGGGGGGTVVVPPVVAVAPPKPDDTPWLPERLAQQERATRAAVLAEIGVKSPEEAKAEREELKKLRDAQKTESERHEARIKELESDVEKLKPHTVELEEYRKRDTEQAAAELAALTEAQRAAVTIAAGSDAKKILTTIAALKPTWATTPTPAPAPPKSTAPAPSAPPAINLSPPDRKAEYQQLKKSNPVAASAYLNRYADEIYPRA